MTENPEVREVVTAFLTEEGYGVISAGTEEAVDVLKGGEPVAGILYDSPGGRMADIDRVVESLKTVKLAALEPPLQTNLPVGVFTCNVRLLGRRELRELADFVMLKPIEMDLCLEEVRKLVNSA